MNKKIKFILKRIIRMGVLMVLLSILSFSIVVNSPIDALQEHLGSAVSTLSVEQRQQVMEELELDKPPIERYRKWAGRIIHGDFGYSTIYNQPVSTKHMIHRRGMTYCRHIHFNVINMYYLTKNHNNYQYK